MTQTTPPEKASNPVAALFKLYPLVALALLGCAAYILLLAMESNTLQTARTNARENVIAEFCQSHCTLNMGRMTEPAEFKTCLATCTR
jgi:hypothetical protein